MSQNPLTLADAAEKWARARRLAVPARGTAAWQGLYAAWQRSGMSPNPELLVRHLSAAEQLCSLLRSWGWFCRVERRPNGWTVATNAAPSHVQEALRRSGIGLETLPPTPGARTPNRAPVQVGEFSSQEAALGSLASSRTAPVLQVLRQGFAGGRAFTRDELASEVAGAVRGARGQRLGDASVAIRAGHALTELERLGYVQRIGRDLTAQGRPGPQRFTLTLTGEERAQAGADSADFEFGENVLAAQVARLEAATPPVRGPLSGPVYRPSLEVQATPGHKLPSPQRERIKRAGYRLNPRGLDAFEKAHLEAWLERNVPAPHRSDVKRRILGLIKNDSSLLDMGWPALEAASRSSNAPRSKLCQQGRHDFEPATGLCRRSGCPAFHHAGQGALFARDFDPVAVREALARQSLTGQNELFRPNPLTQAESRKLLKRAASLRHLGGQHLVKARRDSDAVHLAAALHDFGAAEGLARSVIDAGPRNRSMEGPALWGDRKASKGDTVALELAYQLQQSGVWPRLRVPPLATRPRDTRNPVTDARDPGPGSPLVFATVTGKLDRALALRHGVFIGRDRYSFTRAGWAALLLEKQARETGGRSPNPLSVLVLGNTPQNRAGSPRAGARPPLAANPQPGRVSNPPASVLGVAEVRAHCKLFHGAPVARWRVVELDDGSARVTEKAVTALGLTEATVYRAPWKGSNKHAGGVYEHVHEKKKPLEVYDPISGTTMKLLAPGSGPSDWWRDDRDPQDAIARRLA